MLELPRAFFHEKSYINPRPLSGGACHAVWAVQDKQGNTFVAKMISRLQSDNIRRELEAARQVEYKGQSVYVDKYEDREYFILVLRFIPGEILRTTLEKQKDPDERLRIANSAVSALQYFHSTGFYHNDALPGNCQYNPDDSTGFFIDYESSKHHHGDQKLSDGDYVRLYFGEIRYIVEINSKPSNSDYDTKMKGLVHFLPETHRKKLHRYDEIHQKYIQEIKQQRELVDFYTKYFPNIFNKPGFLEAQNQYKSTPLTVAIEHLGRENPSGMSISAGKIVVETLLDLGADPIRKNGNNFNAVELANHYSKNGPNQAQMRKIVELLERDPNYRRHYQAFIDQDKLISGNKQKAVIAFGS